MSEAVKTLMEEDPPYGRSGVIPMHQTAGRFSRPITFFPRKFSIAPALSTLGPHGKYSLSRPSDQERAHSLRHDARPSLFRRYARACLTKLRESVLKAGDVPQCGLAEGDRAMAKPILGRASGRFGGESSLGMRSSEIGQIDFDLDRMNKRNRIGGEVNASHILFLL